MQNVTEISKQLLLVKSCLSALLRNIHPESLFSWKQIRLSSLKQTFLSFTVKSLFRIELVLSLEYHELLFIICLASSSFSSKKVFFPWN